MRTVEGGLGYPFLENTEISEVEMFPSEDGAIRCKMTGAGDVTSRIFRWPEAYVFLGEIKGFKDFSKTWSVRLSCHTSSGL